MTTDPYVAVEQALALMAPAGRDYRAEALAAVLDLNPGLAGAHLADVLALAHDADQLDGAHDDGPEAARERRQLGLLTPEGMPARDRMALVATARHLRMRLDLDPEELIERAARLLGGFPKRRPAADEQ